MTTPVRFNPGTLQPDIIVDMVAGRTVTVGANHWAITLKYGERFSGLYWGRNWPSGPRLSREDVETIFLETP